MTSKGTKMRRPGRGNKVMPTRMLRTASGIMAPTLITQIMPSGTA